MIKTSLPEVFNMEFEYYLHPLSVIDGFHNVSARKAQEFLDEQTLMPNQFAYIHNNKEGEFYHKGFDIALDHHIHDLTADFFVKHIHPVDLPIYFKLSKAFVSFLSDIKEINLYQGKSVRHDFGQDFIDKPSNKTLNLTKPVRPFSHSFESNYRIRKVDGTYIPITRVVTPYIVNANHEVEAFLSICTDISFLNPGNNVKWRLNGTHFELFDNYINLADIPGRNIFSGREVEVLKLLISGYSSSRIANALFVSINTVNTHRKNLMKKANVNKTVDLVAFAIEHGYDA